MGAKTSEDVLMPDYEPTARVSENTDNDHNLIDMAMLERMGMCQAKKYLKKHTDLISYFWNFGSGDSHLRDTFLSFRGLRADRIELVTSPVQVLSFHQWKGHSQLPEFNILGGLLENDIDISLLGEKELFNEVHEDTLPVFKDEELVQQSKSKDISLQKCKHISGDSWQPKSDVQRAWPVAKSAFDYYGISGTLDLMIL
ncbi:hypothetical protein M0R45_000211 [Rubus argutus]|uniref:Uncharacterized protein n=1 Tax=Rubus argutus TaxID=59490 RepID=A0AAW1VRH8_RUBAR